MIICWIHFKTLKFVLKQRKNMAKLNSTPHFVKNGCRNIKYKLKFCPISKKKRKEKKNIKKLHKIFCFHTRIYINTFLYHMWIRRNKYCIKKPIHILRFILYSNIFQNKSLFQNFHFTYHYHYVLSIFFWIVPKEKIRKEVLYSFSDFTSYGAINRNIRHTKIQHSCTDKTKKSIQDTDFILLF